MPLRSRTKIPFAKFHGLGNTWIVVNGSDLLKGLGWTALKGGEGPFTGGANDHLSSLARLMCDPRRGLGADGLIVMWPPRDRRHDAQVWFFNADGSQPEMSGNGIRCAAAFIVQIKRNRAQKLSIETVSGVKTITTLTAGKKRWRFRVNLGEPVFDPSKIPFAGRDVDIPVVGFPLRTDQGEFHVTITSIGNPHCSLFVTDFRTIQWRIIGREIETHPLFPNRTNVEFVKVLSRQDIAVRFWERGVGETRSSGTGSCAAVVAAVLNGLTGRKVKVHTSAGRLEVSWRKSGELTLVGPVVLLKRGVYYPSAR
jgi:diaminopimelate epimerase